MIKETAESKSAQKQERLKLMFAVIILVMITLPVIIHTRSLLLKITMVEAHWILLEVYAWFFALAFDCSIFMFAIYQKREQAIVFAIISGIVGWLFWCSDLVFIEFWLADTNSGQLWSRLIMGTLWAAFSSYLVFWCSEIVAEKIQSVEFSNPSLIKKDSKISATAVPVKKNETINKENHLGYPEGNLLIKAKNLRNDGLSIREIAEQLGISKGRVGKWSKEQLI